MVRGDLVPDPQPNLLAQAHRTSGAVREYEFSMSLMNSSEGNAAWQRGRAYQIAVLIGDGEEYRGITEMTWMSDQLVVRIGAPSAVSIYHPPLTPPDDSHRRN
jgi:hypothetical protein